MTAPRTRPAVQVNSPTSFLDSIIIEHGPIALLGQLFLKAMTELGKNNLRLARISPEELARVNSANRDSWRPLLPTFDPQFSRLDDGNAICIAVEDTNGRIVGTHAVRLFDWTQTSFGDELTSYRLLYADPASMKLENEACSVTAPSASRLAGRVAFSGAAWYHPDYRKFGLSKIVPRVGKALALSTWGIERIVGIMAEEIHRQGFAPRFGYHGVDWDLVLTGSRVGTLRFALIWIERPNLEDYLSQYVGARTEVDARVFTGDAHHMPAAVVTQR